MREKLSTHSIETTQELWALTEKCVRAEEGCRMPGESSSTKAEPKKTKKREAPAPTSAPKVLATKP